MKNKIGKMSFDESRMGMTFKTPSANDVHVDAILSNISVKYTNDSYIADAVMPPIPVKKESDKYYRYTKNWRLPSAHRADGAEAKQIDWAIDTDTYQTEEYALKDLVTDRQRANADNPLSLDVDATENLTDMIMLLREKRVADVVFASGTYGTQTSALTGAQCWDDYAGSDPINDINTARVAIHAATGKLPNVIVLGYQVYLKLCQHPDILERIKYTQKGLVTADLIAQVFELPRVIVGMASYDSAQEGATSSVGYVWGKSAAILYVEPSPGLKKVSFGYQFKSRGMQTSKWRKEENKADFIEVGEIVDEKVVCATAGYLFTTVIA